MEGTLLVGDFLVLSKSAYGATIPGTSARLPGYDVPRRGDVVVFRGPREPIDIVKRLVGLPGDTIAMQGGTLYLNGVAHDEPYVQRRHADRDVADPMMLWQQNYLLDLDRTDYRPTRDDWGPLIVPPESYFVLGDNRDESQDSRY
jgi:signal peptidase I